MAGKILSLFFASALLYVVQVSGYLETYRGAVVDYHPNGSTDEKIRVTKNVENYKEFMKKAKSMKADIIVFPEMGLETTELSSAIPNPVDRIAPCDGKFETTEFVKNLSCASKENHIYSVVNLLEKRKCEDDSNCADKYYLLNTNVVFDRYGVVIARYSKYNLFDEKNLNHTKDPEIVFFDTDFGVRFGTFICFDILFQTPTLKLAQQFQITDFVFSTFWFSELPFLTALQVQRGWAESNNVNLLASGVIKLRRGSGGSGIYNGKYGNLVQVFSEDQKSRLLIADIPKISNRCSVSGCNTNVNETSVFHMSTLKEDIQKDETAEELTLLKDNTDLFTSEVIQPGKPFARTICSAENFCCDFEVDVDSVHPDAKNFMYRAVVSNRVRSFGVTFRGGTQVCGVVLCNGTNIRDCTSRVKKIPDLFYFKSMRIRGDFKLRNSFQMPSTLTDRNGLEPLSANKYEFRKTEKEDRIDVSLNLLWPTTHLHTFAIWGRDFTKDNAPEVPTSISSFVITAPYLVATLLGFVLFAR